MKNKEQIRELFDSTAKEMFPALKITGGDTAGGWNQISHGVIVLQTAIKIAPELKKLSKETLVELHALLTLGGNCSANGQRLFSAKTQKSTALATDLIANLKL